MRLSRAAAIALILVGLASACSLLNSLDGYSDGARPDASGDAGRDSASPPDALVDAGADARCVGPRWPPRPAVNGGGTTRLVQAFSSLEFTEEGNPQKPNSRGYDLDLTCTCPGPGSCKPPLGKSALCDLGTGVDNAAGDFFVSVVNLSGRVAGVTASIRTGEEGVALRIRNYNDRPDDDEVEFSIFLSYGLEGVQIRTPPPTPPRFDGTDRWTLDPRALVGGGAGPDGGSDPIPLITDSKAYVAGGVLVARLDSEVRIGIYRLPVVGGMITGTLKKKAGGYAIDDGILVGRLPTSRLLTSFESVRSPLEPGLFLCGDSGVYRDIKGKICDTVDILTDITADNTAAPCDALSFALRFTSSPAELGSVYEPAPPAKPCGEAWSDSCPK